MADADGVVETEIDGVQTFWAPCDGPLKAVLTFRAGSADETYLTSGISHLVEHLALFGLDDPARHHNGFVDQTATVFHTHGDDAAVTRFLAHVCAGLTRLPVHRLAAERGVLAAERASRSRSVTGTMAVWRFGAKGFGLVEVGSRADQWITAEELESWVSRRFVRQNAALWLSGPPPAGLRLDLRDGLPCPPPTPRPVLTGRPGWFTQEVGGIAVSAVLPRDRATMILLNGIEEQLRQRLRTERAISYSPWVCYEPMTADLAHVVVFADGAGPVLAELAEQFARILGEQADRPADQIMAARDAYVSRSRDAARDQPDELRQGMLQSRARDALLARLPSGYQEVMADYELLTPEQYHEAARRLAADSLFLLPGVAQLRPTFGEQVPASVAQPVSGGRRRAHRDFPAVPHTVVSTRQGVTRRVGTESVTVRYAELQGALRFPDGGLVLVGPDATHLQLEPTLWYGGAGLVREVERRLDPALVRALPERSAQELPRRQATWWDRTKAAVRLPAVTVAARLPRPVRIALYVLSLIMVLLVSIVTVPTMAVGVFGVLLGQGLIALRDRWRRRSAGRREENAVPAG